MARLQVVPLPPSEEGLERFAFVIDQAGDMTQADRDALRAFATEAGARGVVIVAGELVVDQPDTAATEAMAAALRDVVAIPDVPALQQPHPNQGLPPVSTIEGRLARVWGNRPAIGDPQP